MSHASAQTTSELLETYVAGGFILVPIAPGKKAPNIKSWNTNPAQWLQTREQVQRFMREQPRAGVGLLHSQSQTCALDVDDEDGARLAFQALGLDLDTISRSNPYRIRGRRGEKPVWRVPNGLSLGHVKLCWPNLDEPEPGKPRGKAVVFELRAGAVQDVLPPTIHPETQQPYSWVGETPRGVADLPTVPPDLLRVWEQWHTHRPTAEAVCPWADPTPSFSNPGPQGYVTGQISGDTSVIEAFNTRFPVHQILSEAGYSGKEGGPWLYPHSQSRTPGVRLLDGTHPAGRAQVYSHHAADPLNNGHAHDAFSIWATLHHGGDLRQAVKAAAARLDLLRATRPQGHREQLAAPMEWETIQPLPPLTQAVPSMGPDLLPPMLREYIVDEARAAGLAIEMVAIPIMVAAGGLIGHRLTLKNTPNAPATPANLWGMICGGPGSRKTHAIKLGAAPLERAEERASKKIEAQKASLETGVRMAEARLESLETAYKMSLKNKAEDDLPREAAFTEQLVEAREDLTKAQAELIAPRYLINDPTPEKFGEIMARNPLGITLVRDEMTGFFSTMEKAGREGERAMWLETWNGTNAYVTDRLGRGTVRIPRLCAALLGGIQPAPLEGMVNAARTSGDGLLQRFQLFVSPDTTPAFDQEAQRQPMNLNARQQAWEALDRLPGLYILEPGASPETAPAPLIYTEEAQRIYDAWERENEAAKRVRHQSEAFTAHLSKQQRTFSQLALVFHALELATGQAENTTQVGGQAAAHAARWCEFLKLHALKLWKEGQRQDVSDAREILLLLERGKLHDGEKISDIRKIMANRKTRLNGPRLNSALAVLVSCGIAAIEKKPAKGGSGRPSPILRLHPDALQALDT